MQHSKSFSPELCSDERHTCWSGLFEIGGKSSPNYTIVARPCDCFRLISNNSRRKTNSEIAPKLHNYLLPRCFRLILNSSKKWPENDSIAARAWDEAVLKWKLEEKECLLLSNCLRGMKAAEILKYFQSLPTRTLTRGVRWLEGNVWELGLENDPRGSVTESLLRRAVRRWHSISFISTSSCPHSSPQFADYHTCGCGNKSGQTSQCD